MTAPAFARHVWLAVAFAEQRARREAERPPPRKLTKPRAPRGSVVARVLEALREAPCKPAQLIERTGVEAHTLYSTLKRMRLRGEVTSYRGRWQISEAPWQ